MADIFVNSNATGLNDGSDWANAYTSFASSTSAANGDRVIVATTHSELLGSSTTYTFGTNVSIINSTVSGTNTVTETEYNATTQIYSAGSSVDITFNCADGCSIFGLYISAGRDLRFGDFRTESSNLECGAGNPTSPSISAFSTSSSWESYYDNRTNKSTLSTEPVIEVINRQFTKLLNGTISSDRVDGNANQTAVRSSDASSLIAQGVDCNGFQNPNFLEATSNNGLILITSCKLNTSTTNLVSNLTTKQGQTIIIDAVDSSNSQRKYNNEYRGTRESDTSIYINNPDAFQNQSHRFETNTITKGMVEPLRLEIAHGVADFSTAKTLTVEIAQDGTTTNLTNAEVWIEVGYPLASNATAYDDDRAANTPAALNQTTSTATWVGLSGTNARQKCEVTTTQTGVNGLFTVYLCLAKPSTTLYVNPQADVS